MLLKKGSTGPQVGIIQNNLKMLGYDPLIINCIFGSNTENAVKNFQTSYGLAADGIVGSKTKSVLCPSMSYNISPEGISFIADYERFYPTPYRGLDSQNQTIGYGHVIMIDENFTSITVDEAKDLLTKDLNSFVNVVNTLVPELTLSQNQFDALVSFSYNCGVTALNNSTLLKDIRANAPIEKIKEDFLMWCNCNGERALGLYRR